MRWPLLLTLPLFVACAPQAELPTGGLETTHPDGEGICDATFAQRYVGTKASNDLSSAILEASGAKSLRWGGPDTAFTMDYREDRVNVVYDADGFIERVYCG
ncbi:hypothetical protein BPTFM16_02511 [Altererythrobacter insulae]|nr:hypothetical protein BPTFM16_02511 [Altererythrobacter insulae]